MRGVRLIVHDDAASFIATAASFLAQAEAENSMIAIPVARMMATPHVDDADAYLATMHDRAGMVGAALQAALGGVLLTAAPPDALSLLASEMAARGRHPRSVLGPLDVCEAFARTWRDATGESHVLRFHLRHYELRQAPLAVSTPGLMRAPRPDEHELIAQWHAEFAAEVHLHEEPARHRGNAMRRIAAGQVRLWDDNGTGVAYAGFTGTPDVARVAPVYTPALMRGRGYASALVSALSGELFARGRRVIFLTTDVANPTANRIYQRIGYRPMADHFHFELVKAAQ
jgi:GNAT superfamily N-acetyltransferase